jgi:hypothetical protein
MHSKLDTVTLWQEHGWRVALIVAVLAWSLRFLAFSVSSANENYLPVVVSCLSALVLLNWLRIEIRTLLIRKVLPAGDLGIPFIGNAFYEVTDGPSFWSKQKEKFGDLFTSNGILFGVVTWTEEGISWLWNLERKGGAINEWPPQIARLLGNGAVTNLHGKRHRALRRIMEPAFSPNGTRAYVQVIDEVSRKVLREWSHRDEEEGDVPFHSSEVFKMYSLRLFFIAAFGEEGDQEVLDKLHESFKIWLQGFATLVPLRIPGTQFAKSMDARDRILGIVEQMVADFKAQNPPDSDRGKNTLMGRACYNLDEEGNKMKMDDLKDNLLNLIFAGHGKVKE